MSYNRAIIIWYNFNINFIYDPNIWFCLLLTPVWTFVFCRLVLDFFCFLLPKKVGRISGAPSRFEPPKKCPIGCLRKKSTFMITVFLHNSIQTISNQVHIQNLTYNYTIIKYTNLYINLNWSPNIQISETTFLTF